VLLMYCGASVKRMMGVALVPQLTMAPQESRHLDCASSPTASLSHSFPLSGCRAEPRSLGNAGIVPWGGCWRIPQMAYFGRLNLP
jgi:hypothetical protein